MTVEMRCDPELTTVTICFNDIVFASYMGMRASSKESWQPAHLLLVWRLCWKQGPHVPDSHPKRPHPSGAVRTSGPGKGLTLGGPAGGQCGRTSWAGGSNTYYT